MRSNKLAMGLFLVLLVGVGVAIPYLPSDSSGTGLFTSGRPELVLPAQRLEMSDCIPGQESVGTFELKNAGTGPLTFSLEASCGCSDLAPREGTIPPGGTQTIQMMVRLKEDGEAKRILVTIETNDERVGQAEHIVMARANGGTGTTLGGLLGDAR